MFVRKNDMFCMNNNQVMNKAYYCPVVQTFGYCHCLTVVEIRVKQEI
jgi:hypothetical protein